MPPEFDPPDDITEIFEVVEPRPANTTDRRYWWVRWRKAERAWIATAVVVSICVMAVVLAGTAWLIWQIWLLYRSNH